MNPQDVFPTFSNGYVADVRIVGYHFRLFAHVTDTGDWVSSVYSMHLNSWVLRARAADDAEHAKNHAEEAVRDLLPGKHVIQWRSIARTVA